MFNILKDVYVFLDNDESIRRCSFLLRKIFCSILC